jgi:hypothetical protein
MSHRLKVYAGSFVSVAPSALSLRRSRSEAEQLLLHPKERSPFSVNAGLRLGQRTVTSIEQQLIRRRNLNHENALFVYLGLTAGASIPAQSGSRFDA